MTEIKSVAQEGDRLATLKALRDRLASAIDDSTGAVGIAQLSKQLTDVLDQIAALTPVETKEETPLDEFTRRLRDKRGSDSASAG